ncbi:MAG TPA: TerB family tellurite resistance protein [Malonomonas sp.]
MLKRLLQVFSAPADQSEDESQRIPLAAAVLLLEVAYADGVLHPAEEELIGTLLSERFAVAPELQQELLELADQHRNDSSGLHQYTREINAAFSQPEKERIIEAIWQLVYADGRLDCYEDALMRQLGTLIGLSHRQLIEAKLRVTNA